MKLASHSSVPVEHAAAALAGVPVAMDIWPEPSTEKPVEAKAEPLKVAEVKSIPFVAATAPVVLNIVPLD